MMIAISRVLLFVAQRVASTAPPAHVAAYSLRPACANLEECSCVIPLTAAIQRLG
jgi:hypothetical protein